MNKKRKNNIYLDILKLIIKNILIVIKKGFSQWRSDDYSLMEQVNGNQIAKKQFLIFHNGHNT